MLSKAEEGSKLAEKAAAISERASQEAIDRAEEVNRLAKENVEASIRAAREATEMSKRAAREAAETVKGVFQELISGTGEIGKAPRHHVAVSPGTQDADLVEAKGRASEETDEELAGASEEAVTGIEETEVKKREGAKEIERKIETRLASLAKMYGANKDRKSEEEEEEA